MKKFLTARFLFLGLVLLLFLAVMGRSCSTNGMPNAGPVIGLLEITGPILSSRETVKSLNFFNDNAMVEGILLRIDSPGGGIAPSQEIFQKVKKISDSGMPVFVSMGSVAASGGYYIAMAGDSVFANSGSITGSIGVIMSHPIMHEALNVLGLGMQTYKSGDLKDAGSSFRPVQKEDEAYLTNLVLELNSQFVRDVADARQMSISDVEVLADGRVFSGERAVDFGLIDGIASFDESVRRMGLALGSMEKPNLMEAPDEDTGFYRKLLKELNSTVNVFRGVAIPEYRMK